MTCVDSSVARIPAFQAGGPGSIPGRRIFFTVKIFFVKKFFLRKNLRGEILVDKTFPDSCGTHGLVGYDVRLTRGRSPVQSWDAVVLSTYYILA